MDELEELNQKEELMIKKNELKKQSSKKGIEYISASISIPLNDKMHEIYKNDWIHSKSYTVFQNMVILYIIDKYYKQEFGNEIQAIKNKSNDLIKKTVEGDVNGS